MYGTVGSPVGTVGAVDVGAMVGAPGTGVGAAVVGATVVGASLGAVDGAEVGIAVLGTWVGATVGACDGEAVGASVLEGTRGGQGSVKSSTRFDSPANIKLEDR